MVHMQRARPSHPHRALLASAPSGDSSGGLTWCLPRPPHALLRPSISLCRVESVHFTFLMACQSAQRDHHSLRPWGSSVAWLLGRVSFGQGAVTPAPLSSTCVTKGQTLAQVKGTKEILFCGTALPSPLQRLLLMKSRIQDSSSITMRRGEDNENKMNFLPELLQSQGVVGRALGWDQRSPVLSWPPSPWI